MDPTSVQVKSQSRFEKSREIELHIKVVCRQLWMVRCERTLAAIEPVSAIVVGNQLTSASWKRILAADGAWEHHFVDC